MNRIYAITASTTPQNIVQNPFKQTVQRYFFFWKCQIEKFYMSVRLPIRLAYRIGGLDDQVDEQVLLGVFVPFGEVKEVTIPLDAGTGLKRGFGFVEFEDAEDAAEARDNMNSD